MDIDIHINNIDILNSALSEMETMELFFTIVVIIIGSITLIVEVISFMDIRKTRGDVCCKIALKDKKILFKIFEIVFLYAFPIVLLIYSIYYSIYHNVSFLKVPAKAIAYIFATILTLFRFKQYGTVTTKGIILNSGFHQWKDIERYEWLRDDSIKVFIKGAYYEEIFSNIIISKSKLDEIFKENIKESS